VTARGGLTAPSADGAVQEGHRIRGTPRVTRILGPSFVAAIACADPSPATS
jgi:hypothetical protein